MSSSCRTDETRTTRELVLEARATRTTSSAHSGTTDTTVYPIGLGPRVDRELLERLAAESGGVAYFPEDVSSLRHDYARIVEDLRRRYVVSYTSTNAARDGAWRAVQIKTRQPQLTVRSRGGYRVMQTTEWQRRIDGPRRVTVVVGAPRGSDQRHRPWCLRTKQ